MESIIWVEGLPVPQGSKVAGMRKNGTPFMRDANAGLKGWREKVAQACWREKSIYDTACAVNLEFMLPRPSSVKRAYATGTYDIDKLCRAVLDGMQDSGLLKNDNLVIVLVASKEYADEGEPGVTITIVDM